MNINISLHIDGLNRNNDRVIIHDGDTDHVFQARVMLDAHDGHEVFDIVDKEKFNKVLGKIIAGRHYEQHQS